MPDAKLSDKTESEFDKYKSQKDEILRRQIDAQAATIKEKDERILELWDWSAASQKAHDLSLERVKEQEQRIAKLEARVRSLRNGLTAYNVPEDSGKMTYYLAEIVLTVDDEAAKE